MTDWTLSTQIVGSYHKPDWLIRADRISAAPGEFFRPEPDVLQAAKDDATRLAVADQELAGLDVITDGEQRRQSFVRYFDRLEGIDSGGSERRRKTLAYVEGEPEDLPIQRQSRVVGPVRWGGPITIEDLRFLKASTRRPVKMTWLAPSPWRPASAMNTTAISTSWFWPWRQR